MDAVEIDFMGESPEFRILRLTFHRMLNSVDDNSFSDLVSVYLNVFDHLT